MKFICTQENLIKGLGRVGPIAGRNAQLPVLEHVLISLANGVMHLTATDLEIGVKATVVGKVEKEGACTTLARPLLDYVQQLPTQNPLTLAYADGSLRITTKGFSARFPAGSDEDFPLLPSLEKSESIQIEAEEFCQVLSKTLFAAARDETRPEIHSVFVSGEGAGLVVAATDSFRLAEAKLKLSAAVEEPFSFLLPLGTAQEVVRLFSDREFIEMYIQENHILLVADTLELSSRLVDGKYPDYQQIIPHAFAVEGTTDRDALVRALKTLLVFLPRDSRRVRLLVKPGEDQLRLETGGAQRGEGDVTLEFAGSGDDVEVLFNIQYLLEGLQYIKSDAIKLRLVGSSEPTVFGAAAAPNEYIYVVMPIQATS
jgi:DNA polymerase-3 subunit beta